jgi:CHASE2 domain-containing sensor protein
MLWSFAISVVLVVCAIVAGILWWTPLLGPGIGVGLVAVWQVSVYGPRAWEARQREQRSRAMDRR